MAFKNRCKFCGARLEREYHTTIKSSVFHRTREYLCCSDCKFVIEVLRERMESKGFGVLKNMIRHLLYAQKHCTICSHFRSMIHERCYQDKITGCSEGDNRYPFSYANAGCPYYRQHSI